MKTGHVWMHEPFSPAANYVTCRNCGLVLTATVNCSSGEAVPMLVGVAGTSVGFIGVDQEMPKCPKAGAA